MALELHPLFTQHAVLQRERELPIYGRAKPGAAVEVELAGQKKSAVAGADGGFTVTLAALAAGGPHTLSVKSGAESLSVDDILIGDVWLCSGQSNMQWEVALCQGGADELARPEDPRLRLFYVPLNESTQPESEPLGRWGRSIPEELKRASAVGWFFGRKMRSELDVPIGLVMASWGGTRIAAWMPPSALEPADHIGGERQRGDHVVARMVFHKDPGNEGEGKGYARPDFDDSGWRVMGMPGLWQEYGEEYNGAIWLRREVDLPAEFCEHDLWLDLGTIDDFDTTYFNGEQVGAIGPEHPDAFMLRRHYQVPRRLVRPGRNVVAVRVFDHFGFGGIMGGAPFMRLYRDGHDFDFVQLAGDWKFFPEHKLLPWYVLGNVGTTGGAYHGMIHPLLRSKFRGVLWYQGESDASRADQYRALFPKLIASWRQSFGDESLPFLFVQLANFMATVSVPVDDPWAELRDAQLQALKIPGTAMAVAIDVGDADDIHPRDKKTVGERLAAAALARVHERNVPYSGPLYRSMKREGSALRVEFDHAQGLAARGGGKVQGFCVAGADGSFRWADAEIDSGSVRVWSEAVKDPVAVRYAWASNPIANLVNAAGLPASPFRSDDFPLSTQGVR